MSGFQVIIFSLAVAFTWVNVVNPKIGWNVKPFNCLPCNTAWYSVTIAVAAHVPYSLFYLFVGYFVGAVFSAIQMRWL